MNSIYSVLDTVLHSKRLLIEACLPIVMTRIVGGVHTCKMAMPWSRPSTAICGTGGKGHTSVCTHTPLAGQREAVPDKPHQGLKQDQIFSKLVKTHLPLPGVTHVKFI